MNVMTQALVDCVTEDERWGDIALPALAERAVRVTLAQRGLAPECFEIALLACDDARIATLNAEFRGRDVPTNVLSWPAQAFAPRPDGAPPPSPAPGTLDDPAGLGDLALAFDTCAREAREYGRSLEDHVTHLVVHGVLHLLGHDHMRDGDAALMETIEVRLLALLGVANPYETAGEYSPS